jgi:hypothetical protein
MRAVRCHWKHIIPTLTLLVHRLQNLRESGKFQDSAQHDLQISTAKHTHTHTTHNASHLVFTVCFVIYVFYVTLVVDQFIQHINYCLLLYRCVFCTHSFNYLQELNSCDSNKGTRYMSAWEEAFLYKLKSPNVHCLKTCPFPCNVDIFSPAQACSLPLIICKSKTWCQFSLCYKHIAMWQLNISLCSENLKTPNNYTTFISTSASAIICTKYSSQYIPACYFKKM